jgi:hypothetical protein
MYVRVAPPAGADFQVKFERGTKPAGQGLEPAQCAWLDRGMNADESSVVCQQVATLYVALNHDTDANRSPKDFWWLSGLYSSSANWIDNVRSPAEYFEFNVTSDESEKCQRVVS